MKKMRKRQTDSTVESGLDFFLELSVEEGAVLPVVEGVMEGVCLLDGFSVCWYKNKNQQLATK